MCLDKKRFQIYKIADKDLYTLKFLMSSLKSPFEGFIYELNKQYSIWTTPWWGYFSNAMHKGFHSIHGNYYVDEDMMVLCKIPKGSKYFIGVNGDVVSNKIELIKVIDERIEWNTRWIERLIRGMKYIQKKYPNNNLITDEFIKMKIKE